MHPSRSPVRGFTLLEALIVISILGVIAALAVPDLVPLLRKNRLASAADTTAAFLDGARRHAFATGRCTRVIAASATELTMQTRTVGDCVNLDDTAWTDTATLKPEASTISYALASLSTAAAPANKFRVVFRPNGRLVGDADLTSTTSDDGARIAVVDSGLGTEARAVYVTANGRICGLVNPGPVPALAAPVVCP
ncbi:MAG: prepilin-type N-terminal cleavage/methylation domain-containing protein [Deltaproteobacteria bacterium]|nr:prepilin-type N-terminal cleavage/methylation domain-containing protein [Deltaproteobacteria bacterium]